MSAESLTAIAEEPAVATALDFDGLETFPGFHLRQAQGVMHRGIIEVLAPEELTQKQAAVLWLVGANPGVSQIQIGGALRMDRATTMGIVDKLDVRDLVVRERSKVDRRRQELYLTPTGQKLLVRVKGLVRDHERRFAQLFTEDELKTLVELLGRIYLPEQTKVRPSSRAMSRGSESA